MHQIILAYIITKCLLHMKIKIQTLTQIHVAHIKEQQKHKNLSLQIKQLSLLSLNPCQMPNYPYFRNKYTRTIFTERHDMRVKDCLSTAK